MKISKLDQKTDSLFAAILSLKNKKEARAFFRDLCTTEEIAEMALRWQIVLMLDQNISYREIAKKAVTSTATVTRVASWLRNGKDGYQLILDRAIHHNSFSAGKELS